MSTEYRYAFASGLCAADGTKMYSGGAGSGREIGYNAATQALLMNKLGAAQYLTHIGVMELISAVLFSLGLGGAIHWQPGTGGYGTLAAVANGLLVDPMGDGVGSILRSKRIKKVIAAVPDGMRARIPGTPGLRRQESAAVPSQSDAEGGGFSDGNSEDTYRMLPSA